MSSFVTCGKIITFIIERLFIQCIIKLAIDDEEGKVDQSQKLLMSALTIEEPQRIQGKGWATKGSG